jgi:hypothetical protein
MRFLKVAAIMAAAAVVVTIVAAALSLVSIGIGLAYLEYWTSEVFQ